MRPSCQGPGDVSACYLVLDWCRSWTFLISGGGRGRSQASGGDALPRIGGAVVRPFEISASYLDLLPMGCVLPVGKVPSPCHKCAVGRTKVWARCSEVRPRASIPPLQVPGSVIVADHLCVGLAGVVSGDLDDAELLLATFDVFKEHEDEVSDGSSCSSPVSVIARSTALAIWQPCPVSGRGASGTSRRCLRHRSRATLGPAAPADRPYPAQRAGGGRRYSGSAGTPLGAGYFALRRCRSRTILRQDDAPRWRQHLGGRARLTLRTRGACPTDVST